MEVGRHLHAVGSDEPQASPHAPDPSSTPSMEDLLQAAGRGSATAFEAIYTSTIGTVYRLALRVVRDPGMAEDVAQEALVEAWRKAPSFDPARGSAKAWIYTITHRRAVDRVRREQRQREQSAAEAAMVGPVGGVTEAPEVAVVEDDFTTWQSERVRSAMSALSDKQREVIDLAYYRGRTHTEISQDLGVPLGTAKTRIRDALIKLRDAMEEG